MLYTIRGTTASVFLILAVGQKQQQKIVVESLLQETFLHRASCQPQGYAGEYIGHQFNQTFMPNANVKPEMLDPEDRAWN
ncbi:hypothetical protein C8R44DRAFT_800506 [Mycena epipterygia]|nr:hypothetical protein C8R44DRAFT_800506 [Mycena epipterygia]